MRFRVLGPLEVWDNSRRVTVGGPQQRALLAVLLLNAGRVVSTDRLVDHLWGEQPPPTVRGLLQGCVAQLRRALRTGDHQPLVTRAPGYVLETRPGDLDLDRFEDLVARAAGAPLAEASNLLHEALSLWRGPVLDDIPLDACRADVTRLEERRLAVLEQRIDADLQLGRHTGLIAELQTHVQAYPLRERLWAQYMLALYGADRRADALAAYRDVHATLVEQLGVEPGSVLQRVQRSILTGADPFEVYGQGRGPHEPHDGPAAPTGHDAPAAWTVASGRAVPAQLPPAVPAFTGRADHLKQLGEMLPDGDAQAAPIVVSAIAGTAGVGKTALAVHWAHQVRDRFADGQLYVNLRGHAPAPPMRPIEALAGFLHALGVAADQVPVELDQAAALYRTLLADRRMLVLLDNAASAEQVRPLLPASPGCLVLVTSRDRLGGLVARDGARRLTLDVLSPEEAYALLARILGEDRAATEPEAVIDLARLCAHLPLALRIAAANLTDHPHRGIAAYCASLVADDRLGTLEVDGDEQTAVRAAFDLSYAALAADVRRVFRLLGLVPGPDVTAEAAAALAGVAAPQVARLLDRLAGAHLLDRSARPSAGRPGPAGQDRYAFHDLLRLYAAERTRDEDSHTDRAAALGALSDWYLSTVDAAARLLNPEMLRLPLDLPAVDRFGGYAEAVAWLDAERANLLAAIQHGPAPASWLLADRLRGYFWLRMYTVDWLAVGHAALTAATTAGDLRGQAAARLSLGDAHACQSRYAPAIEHYRAALALTRQAGWREGESTVLGSLGGAYRWVGRLPDAVDHQRQALALAREIGRLGGQAVTLGNLGLVYWEAGRLSEAADSHAEALALHRGLGSRYGEALGLVNLGETYHALGRLDDALGALEAGLVMHRNAGDRSAEAETLRILAAVHRDAGRLDEALRLADSATALCAENGDRRHQAESVNTLASVWCRRGDTVRAAVLHERALRLAREADARYPELVALIGLASALGPVDQARALAAQAAALAGRAGYRLLEAHALLVLGRVVDAGQAVGHWQAALALFTEIGAPEAAEVRSLLAASAALATPGDGVAAAGAEELGRGPAARHQPR